MVGVLLAAAILPAPAPTIHHVKRRPVRIRRAKQVVYPQPTFVTPEGQPVPTYQQWARKSYLPMYRGRVTVDTAMPVTHASGAAGVGRIYANPAARGTPDEPQTFFHEMGHELDLQGAGITDPAQVTDPHADALRQGFAKITGDRRGWWDQASSDITAPGERFADAYSQLAHYGLPATTRLYSSGPKGDLTARQWRQVYNLVLQQAGYPPLHNRVARVRRRTRARP